MRTLHAHQLGCPCPSRVATDAHRCAGERLSARGLQGAAGTPPPPPAFAEWKLTTPTRRASSASPVTHLDFLCHVAGGWTWPSAPGGCMWVLSSRTEGCQAQGLCGLRVCALSSGVCVGSLHLPLGTHRAFRRASSITAPLRAGIPHPTQPRPCNQSRSAGSPAWAGSHRYQLTAWVPFPFTRGQLTMADSPHGGPSSPPRERPR